VIDWFDWSAADGVLIAAVFCAGLVLGNSRRRRHLLGWLTAGAFVREVSLDPLHHLDVVLVHLQIRPASRLRGVEIDELRLPAKAAVALIIREGVVFVPEGRTTLRGGDTVLIATARTAVPDVTRRLHLVSDHGRLAGWARATWGWRR